MSLQWLNVGARGEYRAMTLRIKIAAYYRRTVTFIFFADKVNKPLTEAKK